MWSLDLLAVHTGIRRCRRSRTLGRTLIFIVVPFLAAALGLTASHAYITSNPHTATLFGDHPAQRCALGQARELLRTEDLERLRLDFKTMGHMRLNGWIRFGTILQLVGVLRLLGLLVQTEAQPVLALVSDRQVWKNEVAGGFGPIQVDHASNGSSGQHGNGIPLLWHAAVSHWTGLLQGGEQEVVSVHVEGDVLLFVAFALENLKLNDRRGIYWAAICGGYAGASVW